MAAVFGIGGFIGRDGGCLLIGKAVRVVPRHAPQVIFDYAGTGALPDVRGTDRVAMNSEVTL